MFGPGNLKENAFVSTEFDYPNVFEAPPIEYTSSSDYLYMSIETDRIYKIYAARVLPFHDIIALKIQYKDDDGPMSEIVMRPEICLLKKIWDCGNQSFNKGIIHYIHHSKHGVHQYHNRGKFPQNTLEMEKWYYGVLLGRDAI